MPTRQSPTRQSPTRQSPTRATVSVGDRDVALRGTILRGEVGSGAHGMAVAGTDDRDEMGVYVESQDQVLGLAPSAGHYVARTQPEGVRSGPGDVDLVLYALRKFLRLATAGNPTILTLLYLPAYDVCDERGTALVAAREQIVSRRAGRRYLGYLDGQRERMLGRGRQSRVPSRPELIERVGYDTKYASHALRLGLQGLELMTTGRLTLPMPADARASCREVKTGQVDFAEALRRVDAVRTRLAETLDGAVAVRDEPDVAAVSALMGDIQLATWGLIPSAAAG